MRNKLLLLAVAALAGGTPANSVSYRTAYPPWRVRTQGTAATTRTDAPFDQAHWQRGAGGSYRLGWHLLPAPSHRRWP